MAKERISVWILGDQLLQDHPALRRAEEMTDRDFIRVVLIESKDRTNRLQYHRKKLVLLFSAMRHYGEWLREQGYEVDYVRDKDFVSGLKAHIEEDRPQRLVTMAATEYETRFLQVEKLEKQIGIPVEILYNTQFLVEQYNPYPEPDPDKRYIMENFYRAMRQHFGVLMDGDEPAGGSWNYDKENRKTLPDDVTPPDLPGFRPDIITREVISQVKSIRRANGSVKGFDLATTHAEAEAALQDFIDHRLADFGPYEDAMTARHDTLYHSALSTYVNIGLLTPMQMIRAAESAYREGKAPINSVEGFIRQVLGWREYIYWQYWQQMPELYKANGWGAQRNMPRMFWNGKTDMNCIQHVVQRVKDSGYTHHIERLMIVCNFCLLAGIKPEKVADWFLTFYADAYEWVVLPNVIGMGLNADDGRTATKPYIASANYINKMSDYCKGCQYKHTKRTGEDACPFNYLYWNFVIANEETLRANPRLGPSVLSLRHLDDEERQRVQEQAAEFLDKLPYYR